MFKFFLFIRTVVFVLSHLNTEGSKLVCWQHLDEYVE